MLTSLENLLVDGMFDQRHAGSWKVLTLLRWLRRVSSGATALPILEPMDRAELRRHLERLDAAVPALRASSPDRRHFWQAFANMAAAIESKAATSEDAQFVGRRAEEILSWHGLENTDDHV